MLMIFESSSGVETLSVAKLLIVCAATSDKLEAEVACPDGEGPPDINAQDESGEHAIKESGRGR